MNEDTQEEYTLPVANAIEDQIRSLNGVTASELGLLNNIENRSTYSSLTYTGLHQIMRQLDNQPWQIRSGTTATNTGTRSTSSLRDIYDLYNLAQPTVVEPELVTPSYGFISNCKIIKNAK